MTDPAQLASSAPGDKGGSATQLSLLLDSATSIIDEEFRRSERIDAKSRNQIALAGAFFAVVQAGVIGLLNGALGATEHHEASSFVPWLAGTGILAAAGLVLAVMASYRAWRLLDDQALVPKTITTYLEAARAGNPAVGVKLVDAYVKIAEDRRANNQKRTDALEQATKATALAFACMAIEIVLAFTAVAVQ
jgi:fructose-specific phosphotransferase system IIC component